MNPETPLKFLHKPDLGLLIIRVMFGIVGVFHGSQKIFGVWGGYGMKGFAGFLESLHVPAPEISAWMAALAELVGGVLIAVGLLPRLAASPVAITMFVAFATAHHFSFLTENKGNDYPFALGLVAVGLIFTGPGKYSLMHVLSGSKAS